MRGLFVTGTDTGVGKTLMTSAMMCALVNSGLKVVGMKPVASGSLRTPEGLRNDDARQLQAAANLPRPYELVNPYAFAPPIAPHLAAREAGVVIKLPRILECYRRLAEGADVAIVEGVGGWQVPLAESFSLPDLARALVLPVVLVVGLRLGCLNHAQLSARAIVADGLTLAGWIANSIDPNFERRADNVATLKRVIPAPMLGDFSWIQAADFGRLALKFEAERILRITDPSVQA